MKRCIPSIAFQRGTYKYIGGDCDVCARRRVLCCTCVTNFLLRLLCNSGLLCHIILELGPLSMNFYGALAEMNSVGRKPLCNLPIILYATLVSSPSLLLLHVLKWLMMLVITVQ